MFKLITQATCTLILSELIFFLFAKSDFTAPFRHLPFYIALYYLVILAVRAANKFTYLQLLTMSAASSIVYTVYAQISGQILFTKVQAFTWLEILFSCIVILLTFFIGLSALFAFIKLAESWLDKP